MKAIQWLWRVPALFVVYAVLFAVGADLLGPGAELGPMTEAEQRTSGTMLLVMCAIDVALVALFVRRSRATGLTLAAITAALFYFVKTLTSQLEAIYFMPNVTGPMMPKLLAMTVPVAVLFPPAAVWLLGRWRAGVPEPERALAPLPVRGAELWLKVLALSAVVYPVLFFGFGWFVAYRSPELRAFYGDSHAPDALTHYARLFRADPFVFPFEVLRGAAWVAAAALMLRSLRGPWWQAALLCGAWFALLQNDVHLLPNPLMTPHIRAYHFVETATSNFLYALCIVWLLSHAHSLRGTFGGANSLRAAR